MFAHAHADDLIIQYQTLGRRLLRSTADRDVYLGVQADFRKRGHRVSRIWGSFTRPSSRPRSA